MAHLEERINVVMTQPMMDEGQDRLSLIYDELKQYVDQIKLAA